jgi:SAM-dependent methyltransferase
MFDDAHIVKEWDFESPVEQERYRRVLFALDTLCPNGKDIRALEIGCSEGTFTQKLGARCASVAACDLSPMARANAAKRCADFPHVEIRPLDLERDPIQGTFDWVFAMDILEYVHGRDRLARVAEKLALATRDDGLLIVSACRLPEELRNAWWQRWIPDGADAVVDFLSSRCDLRLLHKEFYPNHDNQISGYPQHMIALFRPARRESSSG